MSIALRVAKIENTPITTAADCVRPSAIAALVDLGPTDSPPRFGWPATRPAVVCEDVRDAEFHHVRLAKADGAPTFVLRDVTDVALHQGRPVEEVGIPGHVDHREL